MASDVPYMPCRCGCRPEDAPAPCGCPECGPGPGIDHLAGFRAEAARNAALTREQRYEDIRWVFLDGTEFEDLY